jgi:hypothetical protein
MSKSFNISFEQSFKVTLSEETIQAIRQELVDSVAVGDANPERLTDSKRAFLPVVKGWLQKEDNEFLADFLKYATRTGIRAEVVDLITKDPGLGASKFAPANVKVTPRLTEAKVACVVPTPDLCDCSFCRSF